MAGPSQPPRHGPASAKHGCKQLEGSTFEVVGFTGEDQVHVSSNGDKSPGNISNNKSSDFMRTTDLISAVSQIWNSAFRSLEIFQPKVTGRHNDTTRQKIFMHYSNKGSDFDGSYLLPNLYVDVVSKSFDRFSSLVQQSLVLRRFTRKNSFEPCSYDWIDSVQLGSSLDSPVIVHKVGKRNLLETMEIAHDLKKCYGWMNHIFVAREQPPVCTSHMEKTHIECPLPMDTDIPSSFSGNKASCSSSLSMDEADVSRFALYFREKYLSENTRSSLHSNYFLLKPSRMDHLSKVTSSGLCADYHVHIQASDCLNGKHDNNGELGEDSIDQWQKPVIDDQPKVDILSSKTKKRSHSLAKQEHAAAGALAGLFVSLCLHPIDTIKTVIQSCRLDQKSICYIGQSIISERGFTGLYRGIAGNIAASAPISAIYTFTYEAVKGFLLPFLPKDCHSIAHCTAGACASIATSFVFTPSERIKQQMQIGSHYQSCWNALVGIVEKGGLPSLYAGWGAVLCRNVPHSVIKFYTYESLKQLSSEDHNAPLTTKQTLLCGGLAGSTAALFSTPFDVVKTRLQTQIPGSDKRYHTVFAALQEIRKCEGVKGLYRGLTPRLLMYMSQGALFFSSYEFVKINFL